mmetsp:Transcript_53107/g.65093  ORF Transcript_53107/g.65093 Transcript_53107/m.65093 type:complete len:96 (-) Transcript_53107:17-304(-)
MIKQTSLSLKVEAHSNCMRNSWHTDGSCTGGGKSKGRRMCQLRQKRFRQTLPAEIRASDKSIRSGWGSECIRKTAGQKRLKEKGRPSWAPERSCL